METRRLSKKDAAQVAEVIGDAFSGPPWHEDWSNAERLAQYVDEGLDGANALAFGLFQDELLVAVAMGRVRHWHNRVEFILEDVCVRQAQQGRGLGTILLSKVEEACRALAIDEIGLRTRQDAGAYHFYEKQGFTVQEMDVYFTKKL